MHHAECRRVTGRAWRALVLALVGAWCPRLLLSEQAPAPLAPIVVLRGTMAPLGTTQLQFVADETTFESVTLAGVTGKEILSLKGNELPLQAEFYRQAQLAAGTSPSALQPLYIVLDPEGTWAYAQPWGTFAYVRDGKKVGPVTSPFLLLGEKMDHKGQAVEPTPETSAANERMVELTRDWYQGVVAKSTRRGAAGHTSTQEDFDTAVLDRLQISLDNGPEQGLSKVKGKLLCPSYLEYMTQAVENALDEHGLDGEKLFADFAKLANLQGIAQDGAQAALEREVAETVAHELGHVIQFAALGLYHYKAPATGLQMDGTSHTLETLSTPEFAFVEGWGEANSMVVVGLPEEPAPGDSNRINYASTVAVLHRKINEREGQIVSQLAHEQKLLSADQPLSIPSLATEPSQFLSQLHDGAIHLGLKETDWATVESRMTADPTLIKLRKMSTYVDGLQARRGQHRSRYDFLRSEYAVAVALADLRQSLGLDSTALVLKTMARDRPRTFAELVEDFVHEHPELKIQVYQTLADSTEGILVTQKQVDYVKGMAAQGQSLEIDLDQSGHVPGASANAANPALFPGDMPPAGQDPLDPEVPGGAAAQVAGAPASMAAVREQVAVANIRRADAPGHETLARIATAAAPDAPAMHPPSLSSAVPVVTRIFRAWAPTAGTSSRPPLHPATGTLPDMSGLEK